MVSFGEDGNEPSDCIKGGDFITRFLKNDSWFVRSFVCLFDDWLVGWMVGWLISQSVS
jgi:hypothetical protein